MTARFLFVRFGALPADGYSKNYTTSEREFGISVYEAVERDGRIQILLPSLTGSACVSLSGCIFRKPYEVEGTVVGRGSDGEPLLTDCKIVRELTPQELDATDDWFASEIYDEDTAMGVKATQRDISIEPHSGAASR